MRYLHLYEIFKKKIQKDPYLYDFGFGDKYYICSECDSYKLRHIPKGGFQPPDWKCDNCGENNYAPKSMYPEDYKKWLEDKELKKAVKQYNL